MRRRAGWLVLAGLLLLAAGCGGSADKKFDTVGASIPSGGEAAKDSGARPVETGKAASRDVIYTGQLVVRVTDVVKAAEQAQKLADDVDGYLAKQEADLEGDQEVTATLRVPSDDFERVMSDLADLGRVQERNVDSDDVTDQVVDLEGRLANARTSAERLRALLAKAENVPNIIAIEGELTKRETEIEQITGQLQVLQDQVHYATVTVRFTERDEPAVADDLPGFFGSLKAGGVTLVNVLLVVLAVVGFSLPFLPFIVLGVVGVRWYRRRHPKAEKVPAPMGWPVPHHAPPPPDAPPPPGGAPEADGPDGSTP